jgi:hypothetical protein
MAAETGGPQNAKPVTPAKAPRLLQDQCPPPPLFIGANAHTRWPNSAPSSKRLLPQGNHGIPAAPHHALPYHPGRSVFAGSPVVQPTPVAARSLISPSACLRPLPFGISSIATDFVRHNPQLTSVPSCRLVCCQTTLPPRLSSITRIWAPVSAPSPYLHCPAIGIRTCPARVVAKLSPEHCRKYRK